MGGWEARLKEVQWIENKDFKQLRVIKTVSKKVFFKITLKKVVVEVVESNTDELEEI